LPSRGSGSYTPSRQSIGYRRLNRRRDSSRRRGRVWLGLFMLLMLGALLLYRYVPDFFALGPLMTDYERPSLLWAKAVPQVISISLTTNNQPHIVHQPSEDTIDYTTYTREGHEAAVGSLRLSSQGDLMHKTKEGTTLICFAGDSAALLRPEGTSHPVQLPEGMSVGGVAPRSDGSGLLYGLVAGYSKAYPDSNPIQGISRLIRYDEEGATLWSLDLSGKFVIGGGWSESDEVIALSTLSLTEGKTTSGLAIVTDSGRLLWEKELGETLVYEEAASNDGSMAVAVTREQLFCITSDGESSVSYSPGGEIKAMEYMSESRIALAVSARSNITIVIDDSGTEVWKYRLDGEVLSLQWLATAEQLVATTKNRVYGFSPRGKLLWLLQDLPDGTIVGAVAARDGRNLAVQTSEGKILFYRVPMTGTAAQ